MTFQEVRYCVYPTVKDNILTTEDLIEDFVDGLRQNVDMKRINHLHVRFYYDFAYDIIYVFGHCIGK